MIVCCQDKGFIDIISHSSEPVLLNTTCHKQLGVIYMIERLSDEPAEACYHFALATANGLAILDIKKDLLTKSKDWKQKLQSKRYLEGRVVNNMIV